MWCMVWNGKEMRGTHSGGCGLETLLKLERCGSCDAIVLVLKEINLFWLFLFDWGNKHSDWRNLSLDKIIGREKQVVYFVFFKLLCFFFFGGFFFSSFPALCILDPFRPHMAYER